MARFRARDFEGLYAIRTRAYREAHPFEDFVKETKESAEAVESFLATAEYAGTRIAGERDRVALRTPGSPRPVLLTFEREDGEWRLAD